jgi:hypothetical protein
LLGSIHELGNFKLCEALFQTPAQPIENPVQAQAIHYVLHLRFSGYGDTGLNGCTPVGIENALAGVELHSVSEVGEIIERGAEGSRFPIDCAHPDWFTLEIQQNVPRNIAPVNEGKRLGLQDLNDLLVAVDDRG